MIQFMERSSGACVAIRATGHLTDRDYADFLPKLDQAFKEHGKLNVLFLMDGGFEGWDLKAAWDDTKIGLAHRADFERLAVVGGPEWVRWCIKLSGFLLKGEVRLYDLADLERAWEWIRATG